MERASRSPESRERAISSEPCTTRPNPFEESDVSARKRRRTSMSGASRSRSVDSVKSNDGDSACEDETMKIDTDPAPPQTPEHEADDARPLPEPSSSRVTINLRNERPTGTSVPTTPLSSRASDVPSQTVNGDDDVKTSVEDPEVDMSRPEPPSMTPASSAADTGSPEIEVVTDTPDDEAFFDEAQPSVSIMDGMQHANLIDPTMDFPYRTQVETFPETVTKLSQFITTHLDIVLHLREWIDSYLVFARSADYVAVLESCQEHWSLWHALPELVWVLSNSRPILSRGRQIGRALTEFACSFARLTALFVELDHTTLQQVRSRSLQGRQIPDLLSPPYLQALVNLTRREDSPLNVTPAESASFEPDELSEIVDHFQGQGQAFASLLKLSQILMDLIPGCPRLIDNLGHLSGFMAIILLESARKIRSSSNWSSQAVGQARERLMLAPRFYTIASDCLSLVVEKYINYLSPESASAQINSLTEVFQLGLHLEHPAVADMLEKHRASVPSIIPSYTAEVIAWEWRFTMLSKLIMSSQMQLRVMAVTSMCQDLVGFWKRYGEQKPDTPQSPPEKLAVVQYFAEFLLRTGLVSYILGSVCHPEITFESSNIIGFLLVTKTYTDRHTDLLWQTVTTTQDPRISEALTRMTSRISNLYSYDGLIYFCEKLRSLPLEAFASSARELCEAICNQLKQQCKESKSFLRLAPYEMLLRLIRESYATDTQLPAALVDIQGFAIQKFKDLLSVGPDADGRQNLYLSCLEDIKADSRTARGSLWAVYLLSRQMFSRELEVLASEHDLASLLVDEMEAAIGAGKSIASPVVISGAPNMPRRELILGLLLHQPTKITSDLGVRLWDMLVGSTAACKDDRDASWAIINATLKRDRDNPFIARCLDEYLPQLSPDCFCEGTLEFVRAVIIPLVKDSSSIILDDDDPASRSGIEQVWRIVLTAPPDTIEWLAIPTLVSDIYLDSPCILSFSQHRARKVHIALVSRCLEQLSSAARKLKSFSDGTSSGEDETMVIVASEPQIHKQELLFTRSLLVLREFHRCYQSRSHFTAPDLRSLILQPPGDAEGESAELKFQSFDGNIQTDVKPLDIGRRNTAASLLASLKDATGFDNYRIFYRGRAFVPHESDVCKSLEELQIQNALILVKRETDSVPSSAHIRPGASPVEVEVLEHFQELWEYMSMDEMLAREIYHFLIKLPVDDHILGGVWTGSVSHKHIFPIGEPFKSLYAVHALRDYLTNYRRLATNGPRELRAEEMQPPEASSDDYAHGLSRAMSLIVAALRDEEVISRCSSEDWRVALSTSLVETLVIILKDPLQHLSIPACLEGNLLDRLLALLAAAVKATDSDNSNKLIWVTIQAILECCAVNRDFWLRFSAHEASAKLTKELLLFDPRPAVRRYMSKSIAEKTCLASSNSATTSTSAADFQSFFWPLVTSLISPATQLPANCENVFHLALQMVKTLQDESSPVLDLNGAIRDNIDLLLNYVTYEDITKPDVIDVVAFGLTRILHCLLCSDATSMDKDLRPFRPCAKQLLWKHLFPPWQRDGEESLPQVILNSHTRGLLIDVIFALIGEDRAQLGSLLKDINMLVPFDLNDEDDPYDYELLPMFERSKAIRASCGYVGLRNLSNTCYLNSLFTQLFMNVGFRKFILNADVRDSEVAQALLFNTQTMFGFLQNSVRRAYDPTGCVATIRTYDDTVIDIHNQMDVDEFYNLLFDRWEGQLLSAEAKRTFRSFYGGQLVQQMRSKECEHISERLEPFSAIQCDIKGKKSLEESLQAYVDGEIMEGDNKYRCSTCDQHVDAVKRACLKDIPDNLIFHLKRFDFNLRTLQRNKINDYFSFPHKIDMRPYTIDHLSSPTEQGPEDVFELVGVLVHSGTAESGHYYSYIRERPTSNTGETWIEFNDDIVSAWDPLQMEASCFGGPDYRSSYDGNNVVYDKTYSAYMLFYQRSSSIQREQQALWQSGQSGHQLVSMSPELQQHIQKENTSLIRRHCLYDPTHIRFVYQLLIRVQNINNGQCSIDHRVENLAVQVALGHLDQVASRTKDIPDFAEVLGRLQTMCKACGKCCLAVFRYFNKRRVAFRMMVQRNPEPYVRQETGTLFILALVGVKEEFPHLYRASSFDDDSCDDSERSSDSQYVLPGVMSIFKTLWDSFQVNLRSWQETFGLMHSFVKLGQHEMGIFLGYDYLRKLVLLVSADPTLELPQQYARMLSSLARRMANRPPSYESIIALLNEMLSAVSIGVDGDLIEPILEDHCYDRWEAIQRGDGRPLLMSRAEYNCIHRDWDRGSANIFFDKLISINQNPLATESIIARMLQISPTHMSLKLYVTLRTGIAADVTNHSSIPYLHAALVYCRLSSRGDCVKTLIQHVGHNTRYLHTGEGRSYWEFQRTVFDAPRVNCTPWEIELDAWDNLGDWAPGLLGYYDTNVSSDVEVFLVSKLFQYGVSPNFGDSAEGVERANAMIKAAKNLGVQCLEFLQEKFLRQDGHAVIHHVAPIQRVVTHCMKYCNLSAEGQDDLDRHMITLAQEVMDPLRGLNIDDIEDDASDWGNSIGSSEPMDSVGDLSMQTAGDLNDGELR